MGLLNFLGGAAGAGADILQRERESAVRLQERNAGADYDAMLREKQVRTEAELRKQYEREKIAYENSPEYLAMTAATEETKAANALNTRGKLAPKAGEVAMAEFDAGKGRRDAETAEKIDNESKAARQKAKDTLEADIARSNNPQYLAGLRNEARARHIESAGSMAQAALAKLQLQGAQQTQALRQQLAAARASGDEAAVQSLQQQITDLAFTGKDTAAAYRTYSTASAKLIDLEMKLANADPTQAASIKAEIDEARLMQKQAAKDLGVKLPDEKATPRAAPSPEALAYLAKNPNTRDAFIAKYGEQNLPKAQASQAADQGGGASRVAPPYVPPADSPVGKARAANAQREREKAEAESRTRAAAAEALGAVKTRQDAARLQASPLFEALSPQEKMAIYRKVNGQ